MLDYENLIKQVSDRGGPLEMRGTSIVAQESEITDWFWLPLDEACTNPHYQDCLCGVLRRDMHRRGIRFISVDTQMDLHSQPSEGPHAVAWLQASDGDAPHGSVDGEESILALMLRAWLDAADKLGWGADTA